MSDIVPRPRDDEEEIYVYSREDIENILADCFVDLREQHGDEEAVDVVDTVYGRFTDDFYYERQ